MEKTKLSCLKIGQHAVICKIDLTGAILGRILDLGFIENSHVKCVNIAPYAGPMAFCIRGAVIALRRCDAEKITCITICGGDRNG